MSPPLRLKQGLGLRLRLGMGLNRNLQSIRLSPLFMTPAHDQSTVTTLSWCLVAHQMRTAGGALEVPTLLDICSDELVGDGAVVHSAGQADTALQWWILTHRVKG